MLKKVRSKMKIGQSGLVRKTKSPGPTMKNIQRYTFFKQKVKRDCVSQHVEQK